MQEEMPKSENSVRTMRLTRRGFLRAAALAGLAIGTQSLLAGCGGQEEPAAPEDDAPADEAPAAEEVTLRFVTNHGESNMPLFEEVVANFHDAHPNIKIDMLDITGAEFYDSINAQGVSGDLPDVWYTRTFDVPVYANKGWTISLQPFIDAEVDEVNVDDFWAAEVEQMTWEGELYALPYDFSNMGMFYNKGAFDEAGVDYPPDDWTFADLVDLATQFVEQDADGNFTKWGSTYGFGIWTFWGHLKGWGGDILSNDFSECVANTPESVACLEFFADAREKGVFPEAGAMPEGVNPFAAGLVPIMNNGSWATVQMRSLVEDKFDFDVAALPKSPSGESCITAAGGAWGIAANSEHPEEAWIFNKYLTSTEANIILISEPLRSIPGRKSAVPAWEEAAAEGGLPPENVSVFAEQMPSAWPQAFPYYYQDMDQAWNNIIIPYFNGVAEADAETVLQEFQDEVNRIIALG